MRAIVITIAAALFAAGCIQTADIDPAATAAQAAGSVSTERLAVPDTDFTGVIIPDHGVPNAHAIRALHSGSELLELVGHNPLTDKTPVGSVGTGWGAIGIWKNYACVAQLAGTGSVAIVDITDPANPVVLSQTEDGFVNGDCEFTADGNYLFAGAYLGAAPNNDVLRGLPVPGLGDTASTGITVWDVSDKTNPKEVLFSDTGEYHTHFLHSNEKGTYIVQAYSGNIYKFDGEAATLEVVATATPMDHDMWIAKHPISGKTLLFSGAGQGMVIYDYDDPENPELISEWQPEPGTRLEGWHRQATVDQLVDGRAIMIAAGENCGDGKTEPYTVLDITDLNDIKTLGSWELPGMPENPSYAANLCTFSPHEFSVFDGYVVSGNYHAGIWVFDVGTLERAAAPPTLGYYLPDKEPALNGDIQGYQFPWQPFVWGAFFDDRGYVLAADASSGLYILKIPGVTRE